MQVTRISTYPLKSGAGLLSDEATVTPIGLEHDRRWTVLGPDGDRVSARECRALLSISARPLPDGVRLEHRGDTLDVANPPPGAPTTPTRMSRVDRLALAGAEADHWVSARIGRDVRLVHLADERSRPIGEGHGGRAGETMSLADAAPVHLVTEASVDRLRELVAQEAGGQWLDRATAVERFRPNVVVDGEVPFAEDGWRRLRIGGVTYRFGEHCDRCVMTTIDRTTLAGGKEPIRTLARHRAWDGQTWFGIRLVPELAPGTSGTIRVGDPVECLVP